ncbi:hypothetical protein CHO01_36870 [Cellulomonas hominis]|uniref:Uncharacterized protein n=1 Tax=Cellulomonas hominis TaxID=156981 RepID=A0A511FH89_9CELL|nr:hypothetical protein [Cellulomonas hominis]MBB5474729.1 hypothetical protein [Cellulomonas hominis]NKY05991.1 hypothetical protein [Cellulomonas hominis]GEL48571.1 hypothetical protein CHO01_36870 [Cellulomonas hominis]
MSVIARFTTSRTAASVSTDLACPGGAALQSIEDGLELVNAVELALLTLGRPAAGIEVLVHDTRLDGPTPPKEPFPYALERLTQLDAGAAAVTAYIATQAAAGGPLDPHELTRAVLAAVTETDQRPAPASGQVSVTPAPDPVAALNARRDRVSAFATALAHKYRGSEYPMTWADLSPWYTLALQMFADAGIADLDAPIGPPARERIAEGVYDKMTESSGCFKTSTQQARWIAWTGRMLTLAGFADPSMPTVRPVDLTMHPGVIALAEATAAKVHAGEPFTGPLRRAFTLAMANILRGANVDLNAPISHEQLEQVCQDVMAAAETTTGREDWLATLTDALTGAGVTLTATTKETP